MTKEYRDLEKKMDVDSIIEKLPPKKKAVALLCRLGMVQAEIARELNISQRRVSQIYQEIQKEFEILL